MIIIDWNISYMHTINKKIDYLKNTIKNKSFIIILQEVTQNDYNELQNQFSNIAHIEYSLKYREPGMFDTRSRKLGIAIIVSNDIRVTHAQVLERALLPDRTLMVDVMYHNKLLRIFGLHSITGCQHGKAKEIQYYSFAEAIEIYKPDIIGIDANEPQYDHYEFAKMQFFNNYNKGKGCQIFFETIHQNHLVDSYLNKYDINQFVDGECLACSHIIKQNKKKVRYDFLFIKKDLFEDYLSIYDYDNTIQSGSDHAAIILNAIK